MKEVHVLDAQTRMREINAAERFVRRLFGEVAPGATHTPHHVPKDWIDKYKGKFDQGWDKIRKETLDRQIKLGVVPAGHQAGAEARSDQGLGGAKRR